MSEQAYKKLFIAISIIIVGLVALLFVIEPPEVDLGFDLKILPKFHAILNSIASVALITGLVFIKQKNIKAHKLSMFTALAVSAVFLISYVTYHTFSESTKFGGEGTIKYIYLFILLTHIVLAAGVLPFILMTFFRALTGNYEKHRKIARITFPIWLYVTVTGVIVYLMISPYY